MKVSLNTIKKLIDFELPSVDELVRRINEQLGQVEEIIDLGAKYKGAVIVRVVSVAKHPNADKLSVCWIDDGRAVKDVERNDDGLVQVVCGAPNVHADMWAVWLPPNTTVPASYDDAEPFVLGARELRGIKSNGMLAAGDELAINIDHDGIIELTESDLSPELEGRGLATGQDFAELFGLDDTIIDIENKMFTHRPDLFGQLGVAREISAIIGGAPSDGADPDTRFVNPDWYWDAPEFAAASGLELDVFNDATEKVPRFMTVTIKDVTVAQSPLWLQTTLVRWGSKAINNVVDLTNYIMLLSAQPTHAYDYDKLRGHKIGARMAADGEKVTLLNDKTYELDAGDIVIVDGEGVIGLAGIMGGADSEVSAETKNIVLEVANFDMYTLRKTSMRYGLMTDALTRFNKGQSPLQNNRVLWQLMQLVTQHAGGAQASEVSDLPQNSNNRNADSVHPALRVSDEFINQRLGSSLTPKQIGGLLRRANFAVFPAEDGENTLEFNAPFWRTDIELPEDIVEEVGRLYGFDKLPRELPLRTAAPAPRNSSRQLKHQIRTSLARAGANEILSYSFVHQNIMTRAGQNPEQAYRLSNALSPDLQYYRLSVLPSLLDKVHANIKLGYDEFVLFEIGKSHAKDNLGDDKLPAETESVDGVFASKKPLSGAAFYHVRRTVESLARDLGVDLRFCSIEGEIAAPFAAPFDQTRSARVESLNGQVVGIIGELKSSVRKNFKLPDYVAAFSLDLAALAKSADFEQSRYRPISRFPSTSQDVTLVTDRKVDFASLFDAVNDSLRDHTDNIDITIEPVTIYQSEDADTTRSTTFHVTFTPYERTLTDADTKPLMDHLASVALTRCDAERI